MKYFGPCWVTFLYDNPLHAHLLYDMGTNSDRIFIDLCMIAEPPVNYNSPEAEWKSYINHIIETLPDGKIHWDGGNGAWIYGNQKLKDILFGCKNLKRIPMLCFGHCEERPNSWLTRCPSDVDKLLFLRQFIKYFALHMIDRIGIEDAIIEVWNEPIECQSPQVYATLAEQFGIGLEGTGYRLAIGSNDYRHQDWLDAVCNNSRLMSYVDYITTHYIWDRDWDLGVPETIYGKPHIISEANFLKRFSRIDLVKNLKGFYYLYLGKTEKLNWDVCDWPWGWDSRYPNYTPVMGTSYNLLKTLKEVMEVHYLRPEELQAVYDAFGIKTPYHYQTPNLFTVGAKDPNQLLRWADIDAMEETRMKALISGLKKLEILPVDFPDYPDIKYKADGSWNPAWLDYAKSNPKV